MADPVTPNVGFDLQPTGGNNDTWGIINDANFSLVDTVVGGVATISVTALSPGNYALSLTNYQPRNIEFSGVVSGNFQWYLPPGVGGTWSVYNNTTGAFSLAFASGPTGSAINCPQGSRTLVICDGTTVQAAQTPVVSANPIAQVGLTPVNGTLGTFMTSDSAPALNQGISPTWTGTHTFTGSVNLAGSVAVTDAVTIEASATLSAATAAAVLVPTVTFSDNSTHAASTAFVQANFADSPGLGGTPTATTPPAGNNTTRLATTAFVQAAVAAAAVLAGNNTNGSISIAGIIINYGQLTTPGSSPTNVNYTTPYTSAVFAVVPYLIGANQTYFVSAGFTTSLSHWTLNFGASAQVVGWIAIGQ